MAVFGVRMPVSVVVVMLVCVCRVRVRGQQNADAEEAAAARRGASPARTADALMLVPFNAKSAKSAMSSN